MSNQEDKVKQKSVRFFEGDLTEIADLASELGIAQSELVRDWRKSYERLRQENSDSQGENIKTARAYADKIVDLITTMSSSTEETVKSEQERAIDFERKYKEQLAEVKEQKKVSQLAIKESAEEAKRLTREVEKIAKIEEKLEDRISDKDQIIESNKESIVSLTEELRGLKDVKESLKKFEEKESAWQKKKSDLQEEIKQKEHEKRTEIFDIREELQEEHVKKVASIIYSQAKEIDKAKEELENRLRNTQDQEIARIREENLNELKRIRDENDNEIERIRQEYNLQLKNKEEQYELQIQRFKEGEKKEDRQD